MFVNKELQSQDFSSKNLFFNIFKYSFLENLDTDF